MKILIYTFTVTILSFSLFADENKLEKLPDISHLMDKVCINGSQYYYRRGLFAPVVVDGSFQKCQKNKQICSGNLFTNIRCK